MELLCDVGHIKSHFSLFGDGVSVSARKVHGLRQTYYRLRNYFGHTDRTRFYSFRDGVSVSARKVHGLRQTYHRLWNCFGTQWYS
jgi:hypothetical protein